MSMRMGRLFFYDVSFRLGFTRIPVFENHRDNIVGLLNIKDLALLDPDDCTAVKTLCKYYSYEIMSVTNDTTLDVMLGELQWVSSMIRSLYAWIWSLKSGQKFCPNVPLPLLSLSRHMMFCSITQQEKYSLKQRNLIVYRVQVWNIGLKI